MNVCVFCGSNTGTNPVYAAVARDLAKLLSQSRCTLVYGGGNIGLMGVIADEMMKDGAPVIGVIPDFLVRREVAHQSLSELKVVKTMHERKQCMADLADAFIVFPGGLGTLDEMAEILPVERRMSLVASGKQPETRDALGHSDQQMWELGADGRAQDPWQKVFEIPVRELDGEKREFLMTGSSKGFEGGCKALFKAFGEGMRANAGKTPVIALGVSKYKHSNPAFGVIKTPEMTLVEWIVPGAPAAKKLTKF